MAETSLDPAYNISIDTLFRISNLIKTFQTQILSHSNNKDTILSLKLLNGELLPNIKEEEGIELTKKIMLAEQITNVHNILNAYNYALLVARRNKLIMVDKDKVSFGNI